MVKYLHHVVGTRWKSRVGEIPSSFVVVLDVEFGQFGVLNLQLATSVVDVLSVENLSRVLGGVTRTVLHQRLREQCDNGPQTFVSRSSIRQPLFNFLQHFQRVMWYTFEFLAISAFD